MVARASKSNSLAAPPKGATPRDRSMGVKHLRERASLDRRHKADHVAASKRATSAAVKKYHQKKAQGHAKELKKDMKALSKRKGS
jgi:hypothetical protein